MSRGASLGLKIIPCAGNQNIHKHENLDSWISFELRTERAQRAEISKANNFALSNLHRFKDSATQNAAYAACVHLRLGILLYIVVCAKSTAVYIPTKLLAN